MNPAEMRQRLRNYAQSQPQRQWYKIVNQFSGPTQVMIYDEIGFFGVSAQQFADQLGEISGPVDLYINSPGGEIFDGISIYNQLLRCPEVSVYIDGIAASAASFIAMAASPGKLGMAKNAKMMIHNGQAFAAGDAAELRKMAELLDAETANIASIYADRTGRPASDFLAMMAAETWLSASQAVSESLVDYVYDPRKGPSNVVMTRPVRNADAPAMHGDHVRVDPDGDGDCDACAEGDTDHDYWDADGNQLKPLPGGHGAAQNVSKPHGDVEYADPGYLDADGEQASKSGKEGVARYPIDAEHVEAAWSYINQEKNAGQYTAEQLSSIKSKIKSAMKKHGHEVSEDAVDLSHFLALGGGK